MVSLTQKTATLRDILCLTPPTFALQVPANTQGLWPVSPCPGLGQLCLSHDSQGPGPRRSITKATVTGMVMAWLVAGLEKVRAVDRGPWLPAVGSKTPTVYVMKLGSPNDFSFTKASTAGDPDFTWEEGSVETGPQVGLQVPSSSLDMPF